jgi:hypothetical protein
VVFAFVAAGLSRQPLVLHSFGPLPVIGLFGCLLALDSPLRRAPVATHQQHGLVIRRLSVRIRRV